MATETRTLEVLCPHCMDESNDVVLYLNNLAEVTCDCGETFTPSEAAEKFAEMAGRWEAVAKWVDAAPTA